MSPTRASAAAICVTALGATLALLTGCASSRLSSERPPGERLAGDWKLDPARSDDLDKALEQLRVQNAQALRQLRERQQEELESARGQGDEQGGQGGGQEQGEPGEGGGPPESGGGGLVLGPVPSPRISAVDELMSSLPGGEYLRITVGANSFTVTSGDSSSQYTPGLESEISAQQGDAQQISGWKGTAYVIDTKPQWGPEIIQSFELAQDGKLAMTLRLSGGGIHFTFTRVYDRTTRVAPLAPPTNN